jgi:hypothetical protein
MVLKVTDMPFFNPAWWFWLWFELRVLLTDLPALLHGLPEVVLPGRL